MNTLILLAVMASPPPQAPPLRLPPQAPPVREEVAAKIPTQCPPSCDCGCNEGKPCSCVHKAPKEFTYTGTSFPDGYRDKEGWTFEANTGKWWKWVPDLTAAGVGLPVSDFCPSPSNPPSVPLAAPIFYSPPPTSFFVPTAPRGFLGGFGGGRRGGGC